FGKTSDGGLPLSVEGMASGGDGLLRTIQALLGLAQLACGAVLVVLGGGQRLVGASDGLDHLALVKLLERLQLAACGMLLGVGGLLLGLGLPRARLCPTQHLLSAGERLRGIIGGPGDAEPGERGVMERRLVVLLALLNDAGQGGAELLILLDVVVDALDTL